MVERRGTLALNKKTAIVLIVIFCSIGLIIVLKYWKGLNYFNEGSGNLSVEQIINKSIKIQYRGDKTKEINRIFTADFIKQIDKNPHFYKKKIFYSVEKDFMKSFVELNENQAKVSVRVEDLSGSYIQIFTLTKDSEGNYKVSKIEFDI